MTRRVFFLGLIAYGLLTGLFYRIINLIDRVGWTDAAVYVFSISIIVWVAVYIGLELIIEADDDESVGELDEAVGITGLLLCSLPYAPLAWLGVTILTGWLIPGPADLDGDFSVSTPPMASSGLWLVRFSGADSGGN